MTIDFPDLNVASPVNLLCRRHADSLTVPKGWTIINNREEVQRLFSAPVTQEVLKNNSRRIVRRQKVSDRNEDEKDSAVVSNLFDLVIDDHLFVTADHATVDASPSLTVDMTVDITAELAQLMDTQESQALTWAPRFDRSGDLDGKLRARGRLLGRAFGHLDSSSSSSSSSDDQNHQENYQDSHRDHDHDQSHSES